MTLSLNLLQTTLFETYYQISAADIYTAAIPNHYERAIAFADRCECTSFTIVIINVIHHS